MQFLASGEIATIRGIPPPEENFKDGSGPHNCQPIKRFRFDGLDSFKSSSTFLEEKKSLKASDFKSQK